MSNRHEGRAKAVVGQESLRCTCSLCWFVLDLYPCYLGMTPRDTEMFRMHLKIKHGWTPEVCL